MIAGLFINFNSERIGLVLAIIGIVSVIFIWTFIKYINKEKPEGYGMVLPKIKTKNQALVPEILMSPKTIKSTWIVTFIFGTMSIISYPIIGNLVWYKIITMLSLFS